MQKFIHTLLLAALVFVPWAVGAQSYATVPYTTGFEGLNTGQLPTGWTQYQTSAGYDGINFPCAYVYAGNARNSSVYFEFETHNGQSELVALPPIENISSLQLTFWASAQSSYLPACFEVGVLDDSDTSFMPVDTITFVTSYNWSTGYNEYTVYFANYTGSGERIAMRATGSGSGQYTLMLDDLSVSENNGCYPLSNLHMTAHDGESITIAWDDEFNDGITYTVSYWLNGSTDTTVVSGVTDTFYSAIGLDAVSQYHFLVMPNCPTGDGLPVSGSYSTDCAGGGCDITVQMSDSYGDGWNGARINFYQGGSLSGYAQLSSGNNGTATVHVCSGVQVSYSWQTGSYDSECSYTIYDGGMGEVYNSANGGANHSGTIENPCPSCIGATGLAVSEADESSITLTWNASASAIGYAVYLNGVYEGDAADTTYTFSNLNASTAYTLGVQVICSVDDSANIVSIVGRTACGPMTVPFSDNFDSYDNGFWPACWHRLRAHGTDPSVNAQFHHSGSQAMFLLAENDTTLFCTPSTIPLDGNSIQVRYYAFLNYSSYYSEDKWIKAGVMTDTSDMSTFIALDSVGYHNFNNAFEEREFNTANLDATATYWVAWMFYSTSSGWSSYNRGAIDDVVITELSDCIRPVSASVGTVGARQVELAWDAVNGANGYTVYYGTVNDPTSNALQTESYTDTSVTLGNLQPETHYYAWVATDCGGTESDLRYIGSFTTLVSCPSVTGLVAVDSLITSDGATIVWTPGDIETEWEVILDSNDAEIVTDNEYVITGLDAMTGHTVRVRAVCDEDDSSAFATVNFATACADATCNITVDMVDNYYGYAWMYANIEVVQAGLVVGNATIQNYGETGSSTIEVCSSAPVSFNFSSSYSYYTDYTEFEIKDGGGAVVYSATSGTGLDNDFFTLNTPCPNCVPPTNIYVGDITADQATLYWTAQPGQTSWIVRIDSTDITVSDTNYTIYNLNASTNYTVSVATDCSGDTSNFASTSFNTDCAGGSCDITIAAQDSYGDGWNNGTLTFYQNGVVSGSYSMPSQNVYSTTIYDTATVHVCSGIPVTFSWSTGTYDSEVSYVIYDGGFTEVYNSADGGVSHNGTIDDACPSCMRPTGLIVSAIDSTSLEFTWDVIDTVAGYIVSFNGGAWESANAGAYNTSNLSPNTAYTFSVKALCSANDTSTALTITVKTACGEMVVPYSESFENDPLDVVPSCWTVVRPGYDGYPGVSSSAHTGNNGMTLAANFNDSTTVATSLVPLNGDEIHVSFWASVNQGNTLYAGVMTNLAYDTTFIPLLTVPYNNSTYTLYEFNTSTLSYNDQYYVAFRLVTGGNNHYADIDDINIIQEQGCSYPANIIATPAAHTVDLTWSCAATLPNFVVQYHDNNSTAWTLAGSTFDTTYTVTSLNAATMYQLRVGLICGSDTLWSYISATTTCDLMALPYFENFDSYAVDVMPPCWEWSNTFCTHWDGGVFFRSYHGGGSEYAVLPQLDGNITKLQIEFDCKVGTIAENDGILIGVADAAGVLIAWLDTIQDPNHSRNAHVHHIINMLNYSVPGSAARLAFAQYRNWGEWALIDNINISQLPECYPVDSLQAHNLIDPDHISFTWASLGEEGQWQVYFDTVTASIDSIPDSLFIDVYTRSYEIPVGTINGGGIYTFYVRSYCSAGEQSNWNSVTFGAGTYIMNNSSTADTVVACGLVVYDNGGPIAGYLPNSNSSLVIQTENAGSELEVFGGIFGWGADAATLTIYDGVGTSGTALYTYNTVNGRDTLDTVLATSTTGALTITFVSSGSMCHTGYELYIHCVGSALCERPTQLNAVMTGAGVADVTWNGSSAGYDLYYKPTGASNWTVQSGIAATSTTLTGLLPDTTYDLQVLGICGNDTSTPSFPVVLNTHYVVVVTPCDPVTDVTVSNVTNTEATVSWTSTASQWEIKLTNVSGDNIVTVTDNPYTLTNLLPNMQYAVRVRALCSGQNVEPESDWSDGVVFTTMQNAPATYTLTVVANNPEYGTVTGSGSYTEGSEATITATANDGYYFDRWNDGDTNATRTVTVTADITYTANFVPNGVEPTYYTVTVRPNNEAWGTVAGGGSYIEGSEATITATANTGYRFVQWQDAAQSVVSTSATHTFTVIEPVTYTAVFEADGQGIDVVDGFTFGLYPNPASTTVTLKLNGFNGQVQVDVVDMNGRTVSSEPAVQSEEFVLDLNGLAKGAYFVHVTGASQTAVRKLIVK